MERENTKELYLEPYFKYKAFINECRIKEYDEYTALHRHHVIPVSMGGNNSKDNLVLLSVEDHIEAHRLFAKAFDAGSYEEFVNKAACNVLNRGLKTKVEIEEHAALYKGERNPFFGRSHSVETKLKLSEVNKGKRKDISYDDFYGESRSSIEKEKRSNGLKSFYDKCSEDYKYNRSQKLSKALKGIKSWNSFRIFINGTWYPSITEASVDTGISPYYIKKMLFGSDK